MRHIDKCDKYDFDPAKKRIGQSNNPIATVPHGVAMLDKAWGEINALGGTYNSTDRYYIGYSVALNQALSIIESLGGSDPLKRGRGK